MYHLCKNSYNNGIYKNIIRIKAKSSTDLCMNSVNMISVVQINKGNTFLTFHL